MSLAILYSSPVRDPAWKWLRAQGIVSRGEPRSTRARDGQKGVKWISRAVRYLRKLSRIGEPTIENAHLLTSSYPDIFWAHQLFQDPVLRTKWELEARVLARQEPVVIAYKLGMDEKTVRAYEELFFDVRDRLEYPGYILHCVLGPAIYKSTLDSHLELVWKLYGYMAGPAVLDVLIQQFATPRLCRNPAEAQRFIEDDAVAMLKVKAALAAKTVRLTEKTKVELLGVLTKQQELEKGGEDPATAQQEIFQHVERVFQYIRFDVSQPGDRFGDAEVSFVEQRAPALPTAQEVFGTDAKDGTETGPATG